MIYRIRNLLIALGLCLCFAQVSATDLNLVDVEKHNIEMYIDVDQHSAKISDNGTVALKLGYNVFCMNQTAKVELFEIDGTPVEHSLFAYTDTAGIVALIGGDLPELDLEGEPSLLIFKSESDLVAQFKISFSAEFHQDVSKMRFSRETVGSEVSGTILDKGAYLSPACYYYPRGHDEEAYYQLSVNIPAEWEAISDGDRLSSEISGERKIQTFANPYLSSGNMFMAGPYVVGTEMVGEIEVACYFFAEDSSLIPDYLESTTGYISMYSDMIGPYPFKRFTVVENFFPTGYGMPAWTLLGQQVIRLPFIRATSLGHEVLHNWWGNSVYVDYERGNWCEAATVYGADYHYKLNQSEDAAKTYRKNILKEYVSYVRESNDFPIRDFKGRTSANTRTIGYNKAMMVFHMIEEEIGSEPFWEAWKTIYEEYITRKISWEEWIDIFQQGSEIDLTHIIPQWIDQAGAPLLSAEVQMRKADDGARSVKLTVNESSGQKYRLKVPIRLGEGESAVDTFMVMQTPSGSIDIEIAPTVASVTVDPDYHLFRKLYPEEVEPIVSGVVGAADQLFVCATDDDALKSAYQEFSNNLVGDSVALHSHSDMASAEAGIAPVVLNPAKMPEYLFELVELTDDSIRVNQTWYPREGHTFVLAGDKWGKADKYMVILSDDSQSLPRVGQLTPHYGKYSYLVFDGGRNVGKGQWPVTNSPLVVNF